MQINKNCELPIVYERDAIAKINRSAHILTFLDSLQNVFGGKFYACKRADRIKKKMGEHKVDLINAELLKDEREKLI